MDTPGFGDSDGEDEKLIDEMMGVLANTINDADTIVLLLNGKASQRFTNSLVSMIKRMTAMFGQPGLEKDHVFSFIFSLFPPFFAINQNSLPYLLSHFNEMLQSHDP